MSKKSKIILTTLIIVIFAFLLWFVLGSLSPFESIRKAHNAPAQLIDLTEQAPALSSEVKLTAHRGVNAIAPENTLPAYEEAIARGYYSAECDIKQTSDGTWVLYHDPLLYSRFRKSGAVADKDLKTLQTYPYKTGTSFWKYPDLRIPTLEEYLALFVGTQTRPQIEIKTKKYDSLKSVTDAIEEQGLSQQAIIISFDLDQLKQIRALDSSIELWYLVYHIRQSDIDAAKALGNCWLSADCSLNGESSIRSCLEQEVGLSLWTVNTVEKAAKLYAMGVTYMETDILVNSDLASNGSLN